MRRTTQGADLDAAIREAIANAVAAVLAPDLAVLEKMMTLLRASPPALAPAPGEAAPTSPESIAAAEEGLELQVSLLHLAVAPVSNFSGSKSTRRRGDPISEDDVEGFRRLLASARRAQARARMAADLKRTAGILQALGADDAEVRRRLLPAGEARAAGGTDAGTSDPNAPSAAGERPLSLG